MARRFSPLHCWADYREWLEQMGRGGSDEWIETYTTYNKTCMLEDGHPGDHVWTRDDQIGVDFTKENDQES